MRENMNLEEKVNKTSEGPTITYENIRRITIQKPRVKRDRRGGLHKLKEMIYFLRDFGFKEKQEICYDDVEHAIMKVSQGTDPRTVRKYLNLLVKFGYLKPVGHPISKNTRITVMFNEKVNAKTYYSKKGYSAYVFGVMAPKEYFQPLLNVKSVPPVSPPSSVLELVDNLDDERIEREIRLEEMAERVGVTSEKCVCVNDADREVEKNGETNGSIRKKEEEETNTHTNIETKPQLTLSRQKRNTQGCFIKKPKGI